MEDIFSWSYTDCAFKFTNIKSFFFFLFTSPLFQALPFYQWGKRNLRFVSECFAHCRYTRNILLNKCWFCSYLENLLTDWVSGSYQCNFTLCFLGYIHGKIKLAFFLPVFWRGLNNWSACKAFFRVNANSN